METTVDLTRRENLASRLFTSGTGKALFTGKALRNGGACVAVGSHSANRGERSRQLRLRARGDRDETVCPTGTPAKAFKLIEQ